MRRNSKPQKPKLPPPRPPPSFLGGGPLPPPPPPAEAADAAELEAQEPEALPLRQVHHPALLLVDLDAELGQLLAESLRHRLQQPVMLRVSVHQDHESSSPGEFHPQALTEPDVRLSPHPALITRPLVALPHRVPPHRWVDPATKLGDWARRVERWRADFRVRWLVRRFRGGPQSGSRGCVSSAPPKIPYGEFSPVRLQAEAFQP